MLSKRKKFSISRRFGGMLPVVVDVETTGLEPGTDGLLEIAAIPISMGEDGKVYTLPMCSYAVDPHPGARIDPEALEITQINYKSALRSAISEHQALFRLFSNVRQALVDSRCNRAVLVGHNAWFDLAFLHQAAKRSGLLPMPFHSFTTIDTASLTAIFLGETVLVKAQRAANISFDVKKAHSAAYDAAKTAKLFCTMVNKFSDLAV